MLMRRSKWYKDACREARGYGREPKRKVCLSSKLQDHAASSKLKRNLKMSDISCEQR